MFAVVAKPRALIFMPIVYTYFEPDPKLKANQWDDLLRIWANSWKASGWEPRIIGHSTAVMSPLYGALREKANQFPTVNPKIYEVSCFLRWCAAHALGGGLFADSDVICRHSDPFDTHGNLTVHDRDCSTSVVSGSGAAFGDMINRFLNYHPNRLDVAYGRPHVSDMTIMQNFPDPRSNKCVAFGMPGWRDSELVHFASGAIHNFMGAPMLKPHVVGEFFPQFAQQTQNAQ